MNSQEADPSLSSPSLSSSRWWSKDTVAIVTGANKGIGFALVKRFAELGLTVILTARDNQKGINAVEALKAKGFDHVHFSLLDVSNPDSIKTFVSWFKERFQVLDILVNNAAVSFNEINENSVDNAETVINTNFYGPKMLTEALFPMFRRFSPSKTRILNISSRLGLLDKLRNPKIKATLEDEERLSEEKIENMISLFLESVKRGTWKNQGWPEIWTDYSVSKLALNMYSKLLAKQSEWCGLSVNCFCPGFTRTHMTRGKGVHTADDAANIGAKLALLPPQQLQSGRFYLVRNTLVSSML